jgi:hypothetical protein
MSAPLAHPLDVADAAREPEPIEIDPRPCQSCGGTIDQHERVDTPEGPEFFCAELDDGAADIMRRWELADPRDAWRYTANRRRRHTFAIRTFRRGQPSGRNPTAHRSPRETRFGLSSVSPIRSGLSHGWAIILWTRGF